MKSIRLTGARRAFLLAGAAALALGACQQAPAPAEDTTETTMDTRTPAPGLIARAVSLDAPTPEARPQTIEQLGRTRTDEFSWLRDDNWQQVMRDPSLLRADIGTVLEAENTHHDEVMAPLAALGDKIFAEMRGRIKEEDSSVPSRDREWFYYSRFREGGQYPIFARRLADAQRRRR